MTRIAATGVMAASLGSAFEVGAQDGQATWLWEISTQNGDSVVEPGETAVVTLSLLMESPMYEGDQIALGKSVHDTLGGVGAAFGEIVSWQVLNQLGELTGDQTTTDGISLFNTTAYQIDLQGPFVSDNPIDVLRFEWAPNLIGEYTVEYGTLSHLDPDQLHQVSVLLATEPGNYNEPATWPVSEATISFQVVPAPPTLLGGAILVMLGFKRERRSRRTAF